MFSWIGVALLLCQVAAQCMTGANCGCSSNAGCNAGATSLSSGFTCASSTSCTATGVSCGGGTFQSDDGAGNTFNCNGATCTCTGTGCSLSTDQGPNTLVCNGGSSTVATSSITAGQCPNVVSVSNLCGDPHLHGPNGAEFDFKGQPNGDYVLFSTPEFALNVRMAGHGPEVRFVTEAVLLYRDEVFKFTVDVNPPSFVDNMNERLGQLDAFAVHKSRFSTYIEMCSTYGLTVTQMKIPYGNDTMYYLDIGVAAPGCNNAYNGILGQTYHCKYGPGKEKFVFTHDQEEQFRLSSLVASSGKFSTTAGCPVTRIGAKQVSGTTDIPNAIEKSKK